jgi:hypothetical protein
MILLNIGDDKSLADDLNMKLGIVSSRVALLLRSAEIKPWFQRFVQFTERISPSLFSLLSWWMLRVGLLR